MPLNVGLERQYEYVLALFIRWETPQSPTSDDGIKELRQLVDIQKQAVRLKRLFQNVYKFETEDYIIPREHSYVAFQKQLLQVHEKYNGPRHLLIVYYGGHGSVDFSRNAIWCSNTKGTPKVNWTTLQQILLDDDSSLDVLMILDCCKAGSSARAPVSSSINNKNNTVFVLAACGFDATTPLSGDTTYTTNLVATLAGDEMLGMGQTVLYIASAVYDRLQRLVLPSGACGVSSVSYVLREGSQVLKLQCQPKLVTWAARAQHVASSSTPPVVETEQSIVPGMIAYNSNSTYHSNMDAGTGDMMHRADSVSKHLLCRISEVLTMCTCLPCSLCRWEPRTHEHDIDFDTALAGATQFGDGISLPFSSLLQSHAHEPHKLQPIREKLCLARLAFPDMFLSWDSIVVPPKDTCAPIFQDDEFRHWLTSPVAQMIAIVGQAGSGKSSLAKMLSESLRLITNFRVAHTVAYTFQGPGTSLQGRTSGLIRSFLLQILIQRPDLLSVATKLLDGLSLVEENLSKAMRALLRVYQISGDDGWSCMFLDGLDKCDDHDADRLIEILDMLESAQFKICITSRPQAKWLEFFTSRNIGRLHVDAFTRKGLTKFVEETLAPSEGEENDAEELHALSQHLVERSEGVFLWALMATEHLCQVKPDNSMAKLRQTIDALPQGLFDCFGHVLERSTPAMWAQTACTFELLLAAHIKVVTPTGVSYQPALSTISLLFAYEAIRAPDSVLGGLPPTSGEIEKAISESTPQELANHTGGLVAISPGLCEPTGQGALLSYIHQSVRYLTEDDDLSKLMKSHLPGDYDANLCALGSGVMQLKHIAQLDFQYHDIYDSPSWSITEQAITYAARVPIRHQKRLISYLDELDRVMTMLVHRQSDGYETSHWASVFPPSRLRHDEWQDSILSVATENAIIPYVSEKLAMQPHLVQKAGRPLLSHAILPGHQCSHRFDNTRVDMVRLLLRHGASLDDAFQGKTIRDLCMEEYQVTLRHPQTTMDVVDKIRFLSEVIHVIRVHEGHADYDWIWLPTVSRTTL